MTSQEAIALTRDVEAALVPVGTRVVLKKGEKAAITQALGGSYTVVVSGNMFRVEEKDGDALGFQVLAQPATSNNETRTVETIEKDVWNQLKTCYDPEIPVNIVDLGLVYDFKLAKIEQKTSYRAQVKMTLTAPGCGMGPTLAEDVQKKLLSIGEIEEANVELVWDPPWNRSMLSEEAQLKLGLY